MYSTAMGLSNMLCPLHKLPPFVYLKINLLPEGFLMTLMASNKENQQPERTAVIADFDTLTVVELKRFLKNHGEFWKLLVQKRMVPHSWKTPRPRNVQNTAAECRWICSSFFLISVSESRHFWLYHSLEICVRLRGDLQYFSLYNWNIQYNNVALFSSFLPSCRYTPK